MMFNSSIMLNLYLLRHAKSSWNEPALKDFDRPLAPRGWNTAPLMAQYMDEKKYHPDCIMCSPAKRTAETLEIVRRHIPPPAEVFMNKGLYHAEASELMELVCAAPQGAGSLLLVGHNPGIQELALMLAGKGERGLWQDLWSHFPTAALAVLQFDIGKWTGITHRSGILTDFMTPKKLGRNPRSGKN